MIRNKIILFFSLINICGPLAHRSSKSEHLLSAASFPSADAVLPPLGEAKNFRSFEIIGARSLCCLPVLFHVRRWPWPLDQMGMWGVPVMTPSRSTSYIVTSPLTRAAPGGMQRHAQTFTPPQYHGLLPIPRDSRGAARVLSISCCPSTCQSRALGLCGPISTN